MNSWVEKQSLNRHYERKFIHLKKLGLPNLGISKIVGVSQGTISKTLKRIRTLRNLKSNNRCGRPRVTTPRTDISIKKFATIHPTASSPEIRSALPSSIYLPSITTLKRRLCNENGNRCYRPARKPLLTKRSIQARMKFCKRYSSWKAIDWRKVMFSDETTIKQFKSFKTLVRRPHGKRNDMIMLFPLYRIHLVL